MELLTVILLLINTTVLVMGLRQLRKTAVEKHAVNHKSKKDDVERKKSEELREKQMQNFLSYTGDKQ